MFKRHEGYKESETESASETHRLGRWQAVNIASHDVAGYRGGTQRGCRPYRCMLKGAGLEGLVSCASKTFQDSIHCFVKWLVALPSNSTLQASKKSCISWAKRCHPKSFWHSTKFIHTETTIPLRQ